MLTSPSIIGVHQGLNSAKTKSFDDLTKKPPREKKKGKKEKKRKENQEKNQREKEKEKREKGREVDGSQGKGERGTTAARRRRRKAPQATPSSHEAVAAAVVGNAVSRQNRLFVAVLNIALKTFL